MKCAHIARFFCVSGNCYAVVLSVCRRTLQTVLHDCRRKNGVAVFLCVRKLPHYNLGTLN